MRTLLPLTLTAFLFLTSSVFAEQYTTVDDILGDTFKPVSTDSYDEAIKSGENVVVLFYDTNGMNSPTEWMAHVFKEVAEKYDGQIKFFKFEDDSDSSLTYNDHAGLRRFGIESIPSYQLFKNAENVFTNKGGPLQDEIKESIGRTSRNMEELIDMYKTVDDILEGTSFKDVDEKSYFDEIKEGKVVVFFYDASKVDGPDSRLANVLVDLSEKFPDLKYLSFKYDKKTPQKELVEKYGFSGTPFTQFYKDGKRILNEKDGPLENNIQEWYDWLDEEIKDKLL